MLADKIRSGLARDADFQAAKIEDIFAIKTDPEAVQFRFLPSEEFRGLDATTREVTWVASDESTDAMGDVIRVKGWDLKRFKLNPVLLWAHDDSLPPVGIV